MTRHTPRAIRHTPHATPHTPHFYTPLQVAFNELMSNMKTVPLFGQGLEVYAPLFMVVLCVFTLFNGYARLLKFVGIDHEDATSPDDPEGMERRAEGRKLISR